MKAILKACNNLLSGSLQVQDLQPELRVPLIPPLRLTDSTDLGVAEKLDIIILVFRLRYRVDAYSAIYELDRIEGA